MPDDTDDKLAASEARVAELEERVAQLEADADLAGDTSGQLGDVTPQLQEFERLSFKAEAQAWERDHGANFEEETGQSIDEAAAEAAGV